MFDRRSCLEYLSERISELREGWTSQYTAKGSTGTVQEIAKRFRYDVWDIWPEDAEEHKYILIATVPLPENQDKVKGMLDSLAGAGLFREGDELLVDNISSTGKALQTESHIGSEPYAKKLMTGFDSYNRAVKRFRKDIPLVENWGTEHEKEAHDFEFHQYEATLSTQMYMYANSLLSNLSEAGGNRVYSLLEFYNLFAGGSKGFPDSAVPEARVPQEPMILQELKKRQQGYVTLLPIRVELPSGEHDIAFRPFKTVKTPWEGLLEHWFGPKDKGEEK